MKTILILLVSLASIFQAHAQIQVNQTLQITIQGVPTAEQSRLNSTYQVASNGNITMWEIGTIRAAGLTADQLGRKIAAAYKRKGIYTNPNFQVILPSDAQLVSKTYVVGGQVKSAGPKPFMNGMTLFGAIQAAGGETPFGALTRVKLFRNGQVRVFNLKRDKDKAFKIRPDDMIEIPQKNWVGN